MHESICALPDGGVITVYVGEHGRTFRAGDRVDLDAVAVGATTWRDVLGRHAAHFTTMPAESAAQE